MSDFRPGNTKHEEGHSTEPAAVLGIAAELHGGEATVAKLRWRGYGGPPETHLVHRNAICVDERRKNRGSSTETPFAWTRDRKLR